MNRNLTLAVLAGLLVIGAVCWRSYHHASQSDSPPAREPITNSRASFRFPTSRRPSGSPSSESAVDDPQPTNRMAQLMDGKETPKLTLMEVQPYLTANHRSAESLLGAFQATGDRTLLREAMEKYPNDPRVAFAAVFKTDSDDERRQWIANFKQSAPDNPLPNYLAALDHFKAGQPADAWQELAAVSGKGQYQDYASESMQNAEEAFRAAGYSENEARVVAGSGVLLPQLAQMKQLGVTLGGLVTTYRQAGDEASANLALQAGMNLGGQLEQGGPGHFMIDDLVGIAVQRLVLNAMDPNSPYGASGHTVQDQIDQITQQRNDLRNLGQQLDQVRQVASQDDIAAFYEREKTSGSEPAIHWLVNKYGQK